MSIAAGRGGPRRRRGERARSGSTAASGHRRWRFCLESASGRRRAGSGPPSPRAGTGSRSSCTSPQRPRTASCPRTRISARILCRRSSGSRSARPCTPPPAASTSARWPAVAQCEPRGLGQRSDTRACRAPAAAYLAFALRERLPSNAGVPRVVIIAQLAPAPDGATRELTRSRNQQMCLPGWAACAPRRHLCCSLACGKVRTGRVRSRARPACTPTLRHQAP
jgi:hypothetical protein